jgi:multidrug efflux pump subunit AcrB
MFIFTAKREAFPRVEFDFVIVTTIYPGATSEDIEKHITIPIEDKLREVDGIEEISSSSIEARSVIAIKLDPDLENKDKTVNDIKNAVDMVTDLPEDAEQPEVEELTTAMTPVLEVALFNRSGIKSDSEEFEIRKYAKILEDRLLEIHGVGKIDKKGYREREMIVEAHPGSLESNYVAINEVILALSRKNLNFPGGIIKSPVGEVVIRTIGEVQTAADIENVVIRTNELGRSVRVGDVASVRDSFEEESIIDNVKGRKSVVLTVIKKESADIISLVEKVKNEIGRFRKILPGEYEISEFNDISYYVERRLNVLVSNGIVGFSLVVLVLFATLGWRISIVTALGIPFAFFVTFICMAYYDLSINLMTMFGLIMVLGMLVDDAIVVAENVYRHIEMGDPLKKAVIDGTAEVITPVAGTVFTTVAAFMPLMFMTGIMGKFIWALPAVVIIALIASWLECMFVLPSHIYDIERLNPDRALHGARNSEGRLLAFFKRRYRSSLAYALHHRYIFAVIIGVVFWGTLVFAAVHMKLILFPQGGVEILVIKAETPVGTTLRETNRRLGNIERVIGALPAAELDTYTTRAGIIQENPTDPYTKRGSNYGILMVYLTPFQERKRDAAAILDTIRKNSAAHEKDFVKLELSMVKTGPPVGKPISISIKGEEFANLKSIAGEYKKYLSTIKGLKDVKDDFEEVKDELRVVVDEKLAAYTGITVWDVATTIRSCFEGTIATEIKKSDEEIDIRVIFPKKLRENLESVKHVKVANRMGQLVPLSRVARFTPDEGISVIKRKDWRRVINVTAEIDERAKGVSSVEVNRDVQAKFAGIEERLAGITVGYEGEFKDTSESISNLLKSFVVAAIVIYIILVAIFRSVAHPLIIMNVIPLSLVGVIWTFYLHGLPVSFLALMGVVGLAGVVVNDSIVMVDFIKVSRNRGLSPVDATLEAGVTRLRPIFLTTITTFFGLVPTAYGIGGYDPFLVPMALSLSWGLAFGTLITLFATPILYNIFSDIRRTLLHKDRELLRPEFPPTSIQEIEHEIEETVRKDLKDEIYDTVCAEVKRVVRSEMEHRTKKPGKKKG